MVFFDVLQGLLAAAFVGSGGLKLVPGLTGPKRNYAKLGLPAWGLVPIGLTEVAAAICLTVGIFQTPWGAVGAAIASCTMAGAVLAHLLKEQRFSGWPALVLLGAGLAVLWRTPF